jgi:tetratricopeptide (TPR) repeat protein
MILSLFLIFISYFIYIASNIIYGLREDSVDISSKIEAARYLLRNKEPEVSIEILSEIIKDFGDKVPSTVYFLRGQAYFQLRYCQRSLDDYRKSLSIKHTKEAELNIASVIGWCSCDFRGANDLFEKYVTSYPEDMDGHYNFASSNHLIKNLDKAIQEYNVVISHKENLLESPMGNLLEKSYFNLGVIYALYFAQSDKTQDVESSIYYLRASIEESKKNMKDKKAEVKRKCMIKKAMVPIGERGPACDGWYRTDDLTSLVEETKFVEWWSSITQNMTEEDLKCED